MTVPTPPSVWEDPVVMADAVALWRRVLARRDARLAAERDRDAQKAEAS